LKSFRKKEGDSRMGIPRLYGFSSVSAANYFWEFISWCIFAITTQCFMVYVFVGVSFFRMNHKAQKKHLRYIADFKN
jgi:hypothetical protein